MLSREPINRNVKAVIREEGPTLKMKDLPMEGRLADKH